MLSLGKTLVLMGLMLMILGAILIYGGNSLGWFGHLPGDIRIKKEQFNIYFPLTSMILLSAGFSLLLWIIRKLF